MSSPNWDKIKAEKTAKKAKARTIVLDLEDGTNALDHESMVKARKQARKEGTLAEFNSYFEGFIIAYSLSYFKKTYFDSLFHHTWLQEDPEYIRRQLCQTILYEQEKHQTLDIIYSHYGEKHDFNFFIPTLKEMAEAKGYIVDFCVARKRIYYCYIFKNETYQDKKGVTRTRKIKIIELRDSSKKIQGKLKDILPKFKKVIPEKYSQKVHPKTFNVKDFRWWQNPNLDPEELKQYTINDTEGLRYILEHLESLGFKCGTSATFAIEQVAKNMLPQKEGKEYRPYKTFHRVMGNEYQNVAVQRVLQPAYKGGFVGHRKGFYVNDQSLDSNGEYAFQMSTDLPAGKMEWTKNFDEIERIVMERKLRFVLYAFFYMLPKEGVQIEPYFEIKKELQDKCVTQKMGSIHRLVETKEPIPYTMTSEELYYFAQFYDIEILLTDTIIPTMVYCRKSVNFKETMNSIRKAELAAKKEKNDPLAFMYKTIRCSAYGKMGMRVNNNEEEVIIDDNIISIKEKHNEKGVPYVKLLKTLNGQKLSQEYEVTKIKYSHLMCAEFITAKARLHLYETMRKLGFETINRWDTDGLSTSRTLEECVALGLKIDNIELGSYKDEKQCKCKWVYGNKRYYGNTLNIVPNKDNYREWFSPDSLKFALAGCPCKEWDEYGNPVGTWLEILAEPKLGLVEGQVFGHTRYTIPDTTEQENPYAYWLRKLREETGQPVSNINTMKTGQQRIKNGVYIFQITFKNRDHLVQR